MIEECSVVKRNGSKVIFDQCKLETAIEDAFDAEVSDEQVNEMVEKVLDAILDSGTTIISSEEINDHVERSFMALEYYEEARNFILYREQNKNIRKIATDNDTMSEYIFMNRYSRYLPRKKRRETWNEAVDRVRDMHIKKYPTAEESILWAFEQVRQKRVLPSMRSMQFGGKPIEEKNARMYNCTYSPVDRVEFFSEAMYLLLCGCGVGFSVEFENVNKLPTLKKPSFTEVKHITLEDSVEGWSDCVKELVQSYVDGVTVEFNYKKIRKQGTPIKSGGKAPGHVPLRRAIEKIRNILDGVVERENPRLKTIEAYDIIMHSSDAVLSGGVRRSATICLFSPDDADMMSAKTGNWFQENPQRARSNNSVKLVREDTSKEQFMRIFETQKEFGEPGFYFVNNKDTGTNPCLTGDTLVTTDKGEIRIDELVEDYSNYKVLTYNEDTCEREWEDITDGALTRKDANIIRLELEDGRDVKLTPDHQVYTENRGWIEAGKLTEDDVLLELNIAGFYNSMQNLSEK